MRLPRPYIPLDIRCKVAERMCKERGIVWPDKGESRSFYLECMLHLLFGDQKVELHHRPALCNRTIYASEDSVELKYIPDANDPEFLIYVTEADHDIETRVRGLHGQHSDLALLRKSKRILRKRNAPKRKWPKQKFQKRKIIGIGNHDLRLRKSRELP